MSGKVTLVVENGKLLRIDFDDHLGSLVNHFVTEAFHTMVATSAAQIAIDMLGNLAQATREAKVNAKIAQDIKKGVGPGGIIT